MERARRHRFASYRIAIEACFQNGWTDGLPVVPPDARSVESFLVCAGLKPGAVLGTVPLREVTVTAELVAINAVMAGCRPEYMPVVAAAVRAALDEGANLHTTTGTLAGAAHAVIVNGPIRQQLDVNCKAGCFGPGWRANATIGRALRLVMRNVCRAVPGVLDRATFSTPARYSFCFGENEEESPWLPLHVERGLPRESSAVTVHSVMDMSAATETRRSPEAILDAVCRALRTRSRGLPPSTSVVVAVGIEHMRVFGEAGWSKKEMREYLFPRLAAPGEDGRSPVGHPDTLLFVAAGGAAMPESWVLHPHLAWAVTKGIGIRD